MRRPGAGFSVDSWRLSCFSTLLALGFFDSFRFLSRELESVSIQDSPKTEDSGLMLLKNSQGRAASRRKPASEDPEAGQHQQDGGNRHGLVDQIVVLEEALDLAGGCLHGGACGLRGGLHRGPAFLWLAILGTEPEAEQFHCFLRCSSASRGTEENQTDAKNCDAVLSIGQVRWRMTYPAQNQITVGTPEWVNSEFSAGSSLVRAGRIPSRFRADKDIVRDSAEKICIFCGNFQIRIQSLTTGPIFPVS